MINAKVTKTSSGKSPLTNLQRLLANRAVYVGIPADTAGRKGKKSKGVNNAELLFIQSRGSQARGIPARPVLEPAIEAEDNRKIIARELYDTCQAAERGDATGVEQGLKRTGMAAQNAARKWITDPRNGFAPNAPSTIKRKGSDRPLINSGAMRAAITYVID